MDNGARIIQRQEKDTKTSSAIPNPGWGIRLVTIYGWLDNGAKRLSQRLEKTHINDLVHIPHSKIYNELSNYVSADDIHTSSHKKMNRLLTYKSIMIIVLCCYCA